MKKLNLHVDDLRVESFPTVRTTAEMGTVRAYVGTLAPPSCPAAACQTYDDSVCGLTHVCA